ncbi:5-oxoprolinase subunit PxpB [Algibacter agarivorans]|uniref:5-oxoprolinase subunit PxpB n=1 Tax=Algibacter agarivorans TaxID=1109741 RepID=A0ABP9GSA2_9FLAO
MAFLLTYKRFGERSILVEWPAKIDSEILEDILCLKEKILNNSVKELVEVKTAYNSLLIIYKEFIESESTEISYIDKIYSLNEFAITSNKILWKIPVCYDVSFGIDLEMISEEKNMLKADIITCHSKSLYTIYFIGFLPGFLYLGGLDETLFTPRKATPRLKIEKGAVAIGGNQTGIYPQESPGGWNVIGNSPINFFDSSKKKPCFAKAGDQLQFYPISLKEHQHIKTLVDANVYQLESEVLNG